MRLRCYSLDLAALIFVILLPHLLPGWGFNAHIITSREAVKLLPGDLGVYFHQQISYISEHSIYPDLWREDTVNYPNEGRGHYIDADLYGDYPFLNIPRSWESFLSTYGEEKIDQWGTAPWRIERFYNLLVKEFQEGKWDKARLTAAALSHYISDLHMPLHVVENYDGQLSDNKGVHKRWEQDLVDFFLLSHSTQLKINGFTHGNF